jgi:hypothetical protein
MLILTQQSPAFRRQAALHGYREEQALMPDCPEPPAALHIMSDVRQLR